MEMLTSFSSMSLDRSEWLVRYKLRTTLIPVDARRSNLQVWSFVREEQDLWESSAYWDQSMEHCICQQYNSRLERKNSHLDHFLTKGVNDDGA